MNLFELKSKCREVDKISYEKLSNYLPSMPENVVRALIQSFLNQNDTPREVLELNLSTIRWRNIEVTTEELINSECLDLLESQVSSLCDQSSDLDDFTVLNDSRYKGWNQNRTWRVPPIFIEGKLVSLQAKYFLLEGATRMGLLKGLDKNKDFSIKDTHLIWYGTLA